MGLANTLTSLIVRLTATTDDYDRKLTAASRKMQQFGSEIASAGKALTAAISVPLAGMAVAAAKANADMEALTMGLNAVNGSAEKTRAQLERLKEVAKLPGLGFQEAVRGAINLQAAGFQASMSERALKAFGNALATVGKGKVELDGVILALTQIAAKGKVSAEEINQLQERLPQIRRAMKDAFGTADTEALKKMGIDSEEFIVKIIAEFEKLPPVAGSVKNSWENLKDTAFLALNDMGEALRPFTIAAVDGLTSVALKAKELAKSFQDMDPGTRSFVTWAGIAAAATGPLVFVLGSLIEKYGVLQKAIVRAVGAMGGWQGTIRVGIYVALASEIVMLIDAFRDLQKAKEDASKADELASKSLNRLETHLRQQGADITALAKQYSHGEISFQQYMLALQGVAKELGKNKKVVDEATGAHGGLAGAMQLVTENAKAVPWHTQTLAAMTLNEQLKLQERDWLAVARAAAIYKQIAAQNDGYRLPEAPEGRSITLVGGGNAIDEINRPLDEARSTLAGLNVYASNSVKWAQQLGDSWGKTLKGVSGGMSAFDREVRRTMDNLARTMAQGIFKAKDLGEAFKNMGKSIAESIAEYAIKRGFAALILSMDTTMSKLGTLGKALSGWAGGVSGAGSGGASTAAKAAGGGAGGIGGGGGGVASAAGGWMNSVNMASGLVGAAAGVGSFIMNIRMEGTLNAIEHNTRFLEINFATLLQQALTYWPTLKDIHGYLYGVQAPALAQLTAGAGAGSITFNINGSADPRATAQAVVIELKRMGIVPA